MSGWVQSAFRSGWSVCHVMEDAGVGALEMNASDGWVSQHGLSEVADGWWTGGISG